MTRLVGICSSPVKKGNNEQLTEIMVETAEELGCDTRLFRLSKMSVKPCVHCNGCFGKQKENRYCLLQDDAQEIFEALEEADIILLSSPVYHMRMNPGWHPAASW